MLIAFVIHWYHDHNWHSWWPQTLPFIKEPSTFEKMARTSGQVLNLIIGLLILPASRNSIWSTLYGIPWESLLRVHVLLGYMFVAGCLFHMLCWWGVYLEQDIFPHDVLSVKMYFPMNFHSKPGHCSTLTCLDPEYQRPGGDNWTIPLVTFFMIFLGFPTFGVLTLNAVRRANFELFYYSHHLFLVLFAVVLWHASSSWYFVALGITLWVADRLLRFASGLENVHVETIDTNLDAQVTTISFRHTSLYQAGQFVMLNVPEISLLQWHPFSIAGISSETDQDIATLQIKACGDFSRQVFNLAHLSPNFKIRVDGPYGAPFDYGASKNIILVAGGIGCTPFFALLDQLGQLGLFETKRVLFIWSIPSPDMLDVFQSQLLQINHPNITVKIHVSRPVDSEISLPFSQWISLKRIESLPDVVKDSAFLIDSRNTTQVLACGPQSLVNQAQKMALEKDFAFRSEIFLL